MDRTTVDRTACKTLSFRFNLTLCTLYLEFFRVLKYILRSNYYNREVTLPTVLNRTVGEKLRWKVPFVRF